MVPLGGRGEEVGVGGGAWAYGGLSDVRRGEGRRELQGGCGAVDSPVYITMGSTVDKAVVSGLA